MNSYHFEYLLYDKHSTKNFTHFMLFNSFNNIIQVILLSQLYTTENSSLQMFANSNHTATQSKSQYSNDVIVISEPVLLI